MDTELEQRVIEFVLQHRAMRTTSLRLAATLRTDLGIDGADGVDFLNAFARTFNVDISDLRITDYFGPEMGPSLLADLVGLWQPHTELKEISLGDLVSAAKVGSWPPPT